MTVGAIPAGQMMRMADADAAVTTVMVAPWPAWMMRLSARGAVTVMVVPTSKQAMCRWAKGATAVTVTVTAMGA